MCGIFQGLPICMLELHRESGPEPIDQVFGLLIPYGHKRYIGGFDVLGLHSSLQKPVCAPAHRGLPYNIIMIPVSFELVQGWDHTGFCPSCVNWGKLALYFGWYQIAMLVIALANRRDRARVEEGFERTIAKLTNQIGQLREDHQGQMTGIQDRVRDLREWVRNIDSTLREDLGVDLPPPTVSARAGAVHHEWTTGRPEVTLERQGGWQARLLHAVRRLVSTLRRWVRKVFVDWDEG